MYGSRPRQYLDRSDLDFDLSLDLDLGGQNFKTAITQLFWECQLIIWKQKIAKHSKRISSIDINRNENVFNVHLNIKSQVKWIPS